MPAAATTTNAIRTTHSTTMIARPSAATKPMYRRDRGEADRIDVRRIEPPERERRRSLGHADDDSRNRWPHAWVARALVLVTDGLVQHERLLDAFEFEGAGLDDTEPGLFDVLRDLFPEGHLISARLEGVRAAMLGDRRPEYPPPRRSSAPIHTHVRGRNPAGRTRSRISSDAVTASCGALEVERHSPRSLTTAPPGCRDATSLTSSASFTETFAATSTPASSVASVAGEVRERTGLHLPSALAGVRPRPRRGLDVIEGARFRTLLMTPGHPRVLSGDPTERRPRWPPRRPRYRGDRADGTAPRSVVEVVGLELRHPSRAVSPDARQPGISPRSPQAPGAQWDDLEEACRLPLARTPRERRAGQPERTYRLPASGRIANLIAQLGEVALGLGKGAPSFPRYPRVGSPEGDRSATAFASIPMPSRPTTMRARSMLAADRSRRRARGCPSSASSPISSGASRSAARPHLGEPSVFVPVT